MKKWLSGLLALTLLTTVCAGCGKKGQTAPSGLYYEITGIDTRETAVSVGGNDTSAEVYCYWTVYNCSNIEYQLSMYNSYYGMYGEMFDAQGQLNWDAIFLDGMTLNEYISKQTLETIKFYSGVENLAKANGVVLTEENKTAMAEARAAAVAEVGGEEQFQSNLAHMGLSQESFDRISASGYLFEGLRDLVFQEGSALYLAPEDYNKYATYADHILLTTTDATTGAALTEDEIAAKRAAAEDILAQLQAAEDLPALFAQLADSYSEDPGRQTNPEGYIYTPGTMVTAFEDAAAALEPGQISGIVETDYGFHILLRKNLLEGLEGDLDQKTALAEEYLAELVDERNGAAEVTVSDAAAGLVPGTLYTQYLTKIEALDAAAEQQAADDAAAGSSADAGGEDQTENG